MKSDKELLTEYREKQQDNVLSLLTESICGKMGKFISQFSNSFDKDEIKQMVRIAIWECSKVEHVNPIAYIIKTAKGRFLNLKRSKLSRDSEVSTGHFAETLASSDNIEQSLMDEEKIKFFRECITAFKFELLSQDVAIFMSLLEDKDFFRNLITGTLSKDRGGVYTRRSRLRNRFIKFCQKRKEVIF